MRSARLFAPRAGWGGELLAFVEVAEREMRQPRRLVHGVERHGVGTVPRGPEDVHAVLVSLELVVSSRFASASASTWGWTARQTPQVGVEK